MDSRLDRQGFFAKALNNHEFCMVRINVRSKLTGSYFRYQTKNRKTDEMIDGAVLAAGRVSVFSVFCLICQLYFISHTCI